jgi:biotin carboxylase
MQVAKEEGIRVPNSAVIANAGDLNGWIARSGFPTVLKANGTSGGDGVKIVNTVQEAERAFRKLQSPPLLARAIKRAVIDRDLTLVRPSLFRRTPIVNAQSFVAGHEATSTIFCWEGQVLASLHFEVLEKARATGHATVVRWIDHPEMSAAAEKIARRLKLSGFHGLDFMIEATTGKSYLIEINPRATQVGHLALGEGRDLPAALYSALTGKSVEISAPVSESDTIALFPQEWMRDPESSFLLSAYHDVPWQEPGIVSACADSVRQQERRRNRKIVSVPRVSSPAIGELTPANEPEPATLVVGQK